MWVGIYIRDGMPRRRSGRGPKRIRLFGDDDENDDDGTGSGSRIVRLHLGWWYTMVI